jgi:hypothetical protein
MLAIKKKNNTNTKKRSKLGKGKTRAHEKKTIDICIFFKGMQVHYNTGRGLFG